MGATRNAEIIPAVHTFEVRILDNCISANRVTVLIVKHKMADTAADLNPDSNADGNTNQSIVDPTWDIDEGGLSRRREQQQELTGAS
jgi:hypothetical protein